MHVYMNASVSSYVTEKDRELAEQKMFSEDPRQKKYPKLASWVFECKISE